MDVLSATEQFMQSPVQKKSDVMDKLKAGTAQAGVDAGTTVDSIDSIEPVLETAEAPQSTKPKPKPKPASLVSSLMKQTVNVGGTSVPAFVVACNVFALFALIKFLSHRATVSKYRKLLLDIYTKNGVAQEQIDKIDAIVASYAGKEDEMIAAATKKYSKKEK